MVKTNNIRQLHLWKTTLLLLVILSTIVGCKKETDLPKATLTAEYKQYGTPFREMPALSDVVMYEVNLRALSPNANLQGVIKKLDHLEKLHVNVIWLMPVNTIGKVKSINSPYCVKNYLEINPEFGSLEDLRALTDSAHKRGMAVIIDWVANHTSWDNNWIENKSWYTQNANGDIVKPPGTNWTDVADLNFGNDQMRLAMIDAMKYWILEANIDGYRCDYADGVPYDFWKSALDSLNRIEGRSLLFLAEGSKNNHFEAGFHLTYSWDFYGAEKEVFKGDLTSKLKNVHEDEYANVPNGKHKLRFTTNHDESAWDKTPMLLFGGKEGALAASVISIFTGGVPLMYTGQEVGTQNNVPFFNQSYINWDQNADMLKEYQEILGVYTSNKSARLGINNFVLQNDVLILEKINVSDTLLILVNTRNKEIDFLLGTSLHQTNWKDAFTNETVFLDQQMQLGAYAYRILQR